MLVASRSIAFLKPFAIQSVHGLQNTKWQQGPELLKGEHRSFYVTKAEEPFLVRPQGHDNKTASMQYTAME